MYNCLHLGGNGITWATHITLVILECSLDISICKLKKVIKHDLKISCIILLCKYMLKKSPHNSVMFKEPF
jgi:hypothetical protein